MENLTGGTPPVRYLPCVVPCKLYFIISQKMHLLNTYAVQILPPSSAFAILSTFLITTHMESLPKSLFEMATIEGASDFKIFYYIALPLSKPILATVCITTLISSWNNYIWPLVSANAEKVRPVILQVSKVVASTYQMPGVNFAAYVIASVPLLLIFTVATKPFVEGLTAGAVKA
ncbi:carbohydrate ABC transporter permease [Hungatella hathewayi]|uniref:carbohydrate ABC transporter permease n=1 Tax=Hungatella hathewayi TaxID=154046 RepID=UPI0032C03A20